MKPDLTVFALFIAITALPMAAVVQAAETSNTETIDNIVVVSQKSQSELRRDVYQAEEDFYSVFNRLNDDRDYTVRCFYENATGTNIKNHVCRARFVSKAYSKHAARNGNDLTRLANQGGDSAFAEKTARFQEKMETLIAENPELEEALIHYNTLRSEYVSQHEANGS